MQVGALDEKQTKTAYVDPGYYEEPSKSPLTAFIESNANKAKKTDSKKPIVGPGQAKAKKLADQPQPKKDSPIEHFQTN